MCSDVVAEQPAIEADGRLRRPQLIGKTLDAVGHTTERRSAVVVKPKKWWKLSVAAVVALSLLIAYLEFSHHYNYGHLFTYGLHVDVLSEDVDIGIPGEKKLYRAELTNYGLLPVRLTACDFTTDTLAPGTDYPYAVQRWDPSSSTWQTVMEINEETFCHPVPLGKAETQRTTRLIWPLMSVYVMGSEATGARAPFRKGDLARFVVFKTIVKEADWETAVPSKPFYIEDDVKRDADDSFRVAH